MKMIKEITKTVYAVHPKNQKIVRIILTINPAFSWKILTYDSLVIIIIFYKIFLALGRWTFGGVSTPPHFRKLFQLYAL